MPILLPMRRLPRPTRRPTALRLDRDLWAALERVKAKTGIPVTQQLERAAKDWLKRQYKIVLG